MKLTKQESIEFGKDIKKVISALEELSAGNLWWHLHLMEYRGAGYIEILELDENETKMYKFVQEYINE